MSSSSSSISAVNVSLIYCGKYSSKKFETTSPVSVGNNVLPSFDTYSRSSSVRIIEAYVEGLPIPRASSSFTNPASV